MQLLWVLAAFASLATAQDTLESVKAAFESVRIVPDVIPTFDPIFLLQLTYTDVKTGNPLPLAVGETIDVENTRAAPAFSIVDSTGAFDTAFLIALVNPDDPFPGGSTSFLNYLGADQLVGGDGEMVPNSAPVVSYVGPRTTNGELPQRVVALLYSQSDLNALSGPPDTRDDFNVTDFVERNLRGPSALVGGTFFFSRNPSID
ncbi:PEBP-like protein [Exidia glandulosa HHB12029]|uniref:PEBP-like protein n=1 Tax=Exidia glandulosa HHB12029 TaxID=1314781 RepID=A0A165KS72_EXIGL|nr:PEBP-like protein [Exidia glandulosa HHB12029]